MAAAPPPQVALSSVPADGITNVAWAGPSPDLLVSSWDSTLRLYDTDNNTQKLCLPASAPLLDCAVGGLGANGGPLIALAGALDGRVLSAPLDAGLDQENTALVTVGTHSRAVRCVESHPGTGLLISGSWDGTIKLWDLRASTSNNKAQFSVDLSASAASASSGTVGQQGSAPGGANSVCKVYTMCLAGEHRLVVGGSHRRVFIFDLRRLASGGGGGGGGAGGGTVLPEQLRESSLVNQTRCIRAFPDGEGYALSSIEGRVAIEYFDPSPEAQSRNFAFKCHRKTINGVQTLYPVNAIAFHPVYGTFATGGCDNVINVWDGKAKKRICQYAKYPTSIASMSFNHDGSKLAIAASYTFEQGDKDHPKDAVYVRSIHPHEVMPKKKKKKKRAL